MSKDFASYSIYQDNSEPQYPSTYDPVRVHKGANTVTLKFGEVVQEQHEVQSASAADLNPYDSSDWRSTARTQSGYTTPVVSDDTLVVIDGIQASARDFLKVGYLVKGQDGQYYRPGELPQETPQVDPDEAARIADKQRHQATLPDGMGEAINSAIGDISNEGLDAVTKLGIAAASGNIELDTVVRQYGQATGYDDAQERVQFVVDAYQTQVENYLMKQQGLGKEDLQDFYEWARRPENKNALTKALNDQIWTRRMESWGSLADAYYAANPPSEDTLANAGLETRRGSDGALMVKLRGAWMSVQSAARMGLI